MEKMDIWTEAYILEANALLRLEPQSLHELLEAAEFVSRHPELRELLRQCQSGIAARRYDAAEFAAATNGLPKFVENNSAYLRAEMVERAGMFAVLLVLGLLQWTVAYYRSKDIPHDVLIDTMSDLSIWMKHYYDEHGAWGLDNLGWLLNHLGGRLYRLGRLQFMHASFNHSIIVFRNSNSLEVIALSETGVSYRRDGLVDGTNDIYDLEQGWTAQYRQTDEYIEGHPISTTGIALNRSVRLSATQWGVELRRGDPVLDIHIPEGGPMRPEQCKESFERAIRFYRDRFPEKPFRAFVCTSWLLDPQLAAIVPASSNIAAFQREFYLLPVLSDERETYRRVFGTATLDPTTASRDTGLRRAIVEYAESGHLLHAGAGILLSGVDCIKKS